METPNRPGPGEPRHKMDEIRTALANERTFLAYVRTALAFAATGSALIHFLGTAGAAAAGWAFIAAALALSGVGLARFLRVRRNIR